MFVTLVGEDIVNMYTGQQLMIRWHRAQELKGVAEEEFSSLVNSLKGD